MRELAVQAGNSTLNASDRAQIQAEMDALSAEIDSVATKQTSMETICLMVGTSSLGFQIGAFRQITLSIALQNATVSALGIGSSSTTASLTSRRLSSSPLTLLLLTSKLMVENFSAAALDVDSITQL